MSEQFEPPISEILMEQYIQDLEPVLIEELTKPESILELPKFDDIKTVARFRENYRKLIQGEFLTRESKLELNLLITCWRHLRSVRFRRHSCS
jgi:hypothetical protein